MSIGKRGLVIPDCHADPEHHNERADWLAEFIKDRKPDFVVNMGDQWDMSSLSAYDKGKRSFQGKSYRADLNAGLEFQDRLWSPVKAMKKKMPRRVFLVGNHEHRIERALDLSPELLGTIGFSDYDLDNHYDEVVNYNGGTPGIIRVEGILFAHYFISGVMGRSMGGKWPAKSVLEANKESSIMSHIHVLDYATTVTQGDKEIHSIVAGCYQDYVNPWAGNIGKFWRPGVVELNNCGGDGTFDFSFISLRTLRDTYS